MMPAQQIRIATRESPLATLQTELVEQALVQAFPDEGLSFERITKETFGDKNLQAPIHELSGGYGLFVKELEVSLLTGTSDIAVHSLKDMPSLQPEELEVIPALDRADPRDVWICPTRQTFQSLPSGAKVGSSSLRRVAQMRRLRPDLTYLPIRGNLQTRFRKLDEGHYDAIILAAAGLHRLQLQERITHYFDPIEELVPAVSQGVLGVEYRLDEKDRLSPYLKALGKPNLAIITKAERSCMLRLEGGCQLPLGVYVQATDSSSQSYRMKALLAHPDGEPWVERSESFNSAEEAEACGLAVADALLADGGQAIKAALASPN